MGKIINLDKYLNKRNNKHQKKNEPFARVDFRVSKNCCNTDSYGVICLQCGQCGRKFNSRGEPIDY